MLIGARAVQGIFAALLTPSVLSLLTTTFTSPRERGRAFGIYTAIVLGGASFGLVLGGVLTEYLNWRWCLYVNVPVAALVAFGASGMIPSRSGRSGISLDIPGTILGCAGLVALVYALGEAANDGWSSPGVVDPLVAAAVLLVLFVVVQTKVASPLLPLRIFANASRVGSFLCIALALLSLAGMFLLLTYLLQSIDHYSPVQAGFAFLPLMVINGLSATQLASRLMAHMPTRLLIAPGLLIAAIGMALFSRLTPGSSYVAGVLPTEVLLGLGVGLAMVPCVSTATSHSRAQDVGITSAMTSTSQQIGASIGTALLNTIAATATATYVAAHAHSARLAARATVHGFALATKWAAAALVIGAIVAVVLIDADPRSVRVEAAQVEA
jgi:EmrB/QacA subfamily drug resistance transporter